MKHPKFIIQKSTDHQFHFNLLSVNGRVLLTGGMYTTRQNCVDGITSVILNAENEDNFDKKTDEGPTYYFNLKSAQNHQIIGTSENYTTASSRDKGIDATIRDAPIAGTEDLTS